MTHDAVRVRPKDVTIVTGGKCVKSLTQLRPRGFVDPTSRRHALLFAVVVSCSVMLPSPVDASAVSCATVLTGDVRLEADLICSESALIVGADGVTIDLNGYQIRGSGTGAGVSATGYRSLTVTNGTISGFSVGVGLFNHEDALLRGLKLSQNRWGLSSSRGTGNRLVHSLVSGSFEFPVVAHESEREMVVSDNRFAGNRYELAFSWNSARGHIVRNHFNGPGVSITEADGFVIEDNRFSGGGISLFSSGSNGVRRNHILDSPRVGVSIAGPFARGNHIEKNVIAGNDVGVMIRPVYVQRTRISMNQIRDNRSAGIDMRVRAEWADGSEISQNVVHRNGFAPSTNSAADGLRVEISPGAGEVVVSRNKAIHNAGVGINVSGVIDGGGNIAKQNGDPVQCIGVVC